MTRVRNRNLKEKILEEMTADYSNALDKNFDLAKQLIKITKDGKVDVLHKDEFSGKQEILLYLAGKLYAKEAGLIKTEEAGNKELMEELGIPKGSVLPWIKDLRDHKKIKQIKKGKFANYTIPISLIEETLTSAHKKIGKLK